MTLILAGLLLAIAAFLYGADRWCQNAAVNLTGAAVVLVFISLCLIAYYYWQTPSPDTSHLW